MGTLIWTWCNLTHCSEEVTKAKSKKKNENDHFLLAFYF